MQLDGLLGETVRPLFPGELQVQAWLCQAQVWTLSIACWDGGGADTGVHSPTEAYYILYLILVAPVKRPGKTTLGSPSSLSWLQSP